MRNLHYIFTSPAAPVQAQGIICGRPFYFRSRHGGWSFSVSEHPEVSPVDIQLPEQGMLYGMLIEEGYGDEPLASGSMPLEIAAAIIERCADIYIAHLFGKHHFS